MRTLFLLLALCAQNAAVSAVFTDYLQAAAFLSGCQCVENLPEDESERAYDLNLHPIRLNSASADRLLATGFFTPFQAASILDYRSRNGDILSVAELSAVPGIGERMASALSFFVSFESGLLPTQRHSGGRTDVQGSMCNTVKSSAVQSRLKLSAESTRGWSAGLCATDVLQSAYSRYRGGGVLSDVIVGSLNARFGQGLTFSSGFSMGGVQSLSSLSRNPTGITPSATSNSSYALNGLSVALRFGKLTLQSFSTFDLATQALNFSVLTSRSTAGLTFARSGKTLSVGVDAKSTVGSFTLWGEASACLNGGNLGSAALAGVYYNLAYRRRIALMLRSYSTGYVNPYASAVRSGSKCSDQTGLDLGVDYDDFSALLDVYRKPGTGDGQARLISTYSHSWSGAALECRLNSRFVGSARRELRLTGTLTRGVIELSARGQVLKGESWAGLAYVQTALKGRNPSGKAAATLRITYFHASDWNDRLYGYSPDVPGFFSVRAYYGHGLEWAIYLKAKGLAFRIGRTAYFDGKAPKLEMRLQVSLRTSGSFLRPEQARNWSK